MMEYALINYFKTLLHLHPQKKEYIYFNPEGDFQDIRGFAPIEDYSFVVFSFYCLIVGALLFMGIRWFYHRSQWYKTKQTKRLAKEYLLGFNEMDAKSYAYLFSKWSPYLVTPQTQEFCQFISIHLKRYKYVKESGVLSENEKNAIRHFLGCSQ